MRISVVLPTRNPHPARLAEVLAGLRAQTLPSNEWELCIIDNGSAPPMSAGALDAGFPLRIVAEPRPGLLWARLCGVQHTQGDYLVFIDDDTIPDPGFLAAAVAFMDAHPRAATAGGKIHPRYEAPPPPWIGGVAWLLALRNNGEEPLEWSVKDGTPLPHWTPIGAGLLVRRAALVPGYLEHAKKHASLIERLSWRGQGAGGVEDKDLVLYCLRAGWSTGYEPKMILTHIIPEGRLQAAYFERLLPSVQRLWAQTLHAHGLESRPPIHPATLPLRKAKAWFAFKAWQSPADRFNWLSSCGYLEGLAANYRHPFRYEYAAEFSGGGNSGEPR